MTAADIAAESRGLIPDLLDDNQTMVSLVGKVWQQQAVSKTPSSNQVRRCYPQSSRKRKIQSIVSELKSILFIPFSSSSGPTAS